MDARPTSTTAASATGRTRGRPRRFDPEAAIATAQRLFRERGYDGVSVADIGAALGITPPSFYNAFGSKAALFDKVLDRYLASSRQFVPEALMREDDVAAAIERLLEEAARRYAASEGISGCLILDGARGSGDVEARRLTARRMAETQAMIAARIAEEHPARADQLAAIVLIAMKGMSAAAHDGAGAEELAAFARAAVDGFKLAMRRA